MTGGAAGQAQQQRVEREEGVAPLVAPAVLRHAEEVRSVPTGERAQQGCRRTAGLERRLQRSLREVVG